MTFFTLISIVALLLGVILLILGGLDRLPKYRTGIIISGLFLLAVAIGAYLVNQNKPAVPSEAVVTPTGAPTQAPVVSQSVEESPISPISPLSMPEATVNEVSVSEVGFMGCLLFSSNSTGNSEIYKLQQSHDKVQQLTNSSGLDIEPAWSPDGQKIAFASNRPDEAGFQIYVMNADGSNQQRVGEAQPGDNTHPSWSPDGRQLIFQSQRDTNGDPLDDNSDIYMMNSDGSNINVLAFHSADDTEPVWSPDGSKIAFLSERSGQDEVYTMSPDGTEITQLTNIDVLKSGLNWAEDSQHLIFEGSGELYSVDIGTQETTKFFALKASNEAAPLWAEDGKLLIFSSDRSGNWELYAMVPGNETKIGWAQLTHTPGDDRNPSWFPCKE